MNESNDPLNPASTHPSHAYIHTHSLSLSHSSTHPHTHTHTSHTHKQTSKSEPASLVEKYSVTVMKAFHGKSTPTPSSSIKAYSSPCLAIHSRPGTRTNPNKQHVPGLGMSAATTHAHTRTHTRAHAHTRIHANMGHQERTACRRRTRHGPPRARAQIGLRKAWCSLKLAGRKG